MTTQNKRNEKREHRVHLFDEDTEKRRTLLTQGTFQPAAGTLNTLLRITNYELQTWKKHHKTLRIIVRNSIVPPRDHRKRSIGTNPDLNQLRPPVCCDYSRPLRLQYYSSLPSDYCSSRHHWCWNLPCSRHPRILMRSCCLLLWSLVVWHVYDRSMARIWGH